jgi:hypothetical protein
MTRSIIIIPAAIRDQANAAAKRVDLVGGEFTFGVGLLANASADDKVEADYYVTNWQFEAEDGRERLETELRREGIWGQVRMHDLDRADPAIALPRLETVMEVEQVKRRRSGLEG